MAQATLTVKLGAIAANWRALDRMSAPRVETAAVVKANAYGTGIRRTAARLAEEGARKFFIATADEGAELRQALGDGPEIYVFGGHMRGDATAITDLDLIPILNSPQQFRRQKEAAPTARFGVQLDTGMNRLGLEPADWAVLRDEVTASNPALVMSHLACADEPDHAMNAQQLATFEDMTQGLQVPRSLSATGGILLGYEYHFDLTRPGIGLYAGTPFDDGTPAIDLEVPVVQVRDLDVGETVGYGNTWTAQRPTRIATLSIGYADGLPRASGAGGLLAFADGQACPVVGRVSMDLVTVDVTALTEAPESMSIICDDQPVDDIAEAAGTIGYEIFTSLGRRYQRRYPAA